MSAKRTLELSQLLIWTALVAGELFDFHVIQTLQNYTDGETLCQALGYDGLAVVSSPEMYNHALRITKASRSARGRAVYIGLRFYPETGVTAWDDGTSTASDTPWRGNIIVGATLAVIRVQGELKLTTGENGRFALCGNHPNTALETRGNSLLGQQPIGVSSNLSVIKSWSYLECVALCGRDHGCRAAEFNLDLLTCTLLGPGSYTGLAPNPRTQTFLRHEFLNDVEL